MTPLSSLLPTTITVDAVTQVCEVWGAEAPDDIIPCSNGIWLAMDALGPLASTVWRAEFAFGVSCAEGGGCPARSPTAAHVSASSRLGTTFVVDVQRDQSGGLVVFPAVEGRPTPLPAFDAPAVARPVVGIDPPVEVTDRVPLPFCGEEAAPPGGPYDESARRCFLNGVLAAQPVEFIASGSTTEGGSVLTIHRFGGAGPIVRFIQEGTSWSRVACGIAPTETDVVFNPDGECRSTDL